MKNDVGQLNLSRLTEF